MANQEQLVLLKQGSSDWNRWRERHPEIQINLSSADLREAQLMGANLSSANLTHAWLGRAGLSGADLSSANLRDANLVGARLEKANLTNADLRYTVLDDAFFNKANLSKANLTKVNLYQVDFSGANLTEAQLSEAQLSEANLGRANLSETNLSGANLIRAKLGNANLSYTNLSGADLSGASLLGANLHGANLQGANLRYASLIGTNLTNAMLKECNIYGISAWDIKLDGAIQLNLTITPDYQPIITVDNLKIAQFIYLLINNAEIRDAIDTIAKKAVLILGRFGKRKPVLDALRNELRKHNYLPILFDFENPKSRDVTETVRTLAHLARFILADLTDPSSIPLELDTIAPILEVPIQPLLLDANREFSMFNSLSKYDWVLPIHKYQDLPSLLASFENLLASAEEKVEELAIKKARRLIKQ